MPSLRRCPACYPLDSFTTRHRWPIWGHMTLSQVFTPSGRREWREQKPLVVAAHRTAREATDHGATDTGAPSLAVTPALVLALRTIVRDWDANEPMDSDVVSECVEIIRAALGLGGEE